MAPLRPIWLLLAILGTACSSSSAPRGSAANQLPDEGGLAPTKIASVPGDNLRVDGFTADGRYLIARDRSAIVYELEGAKGTLRERGRFGFAEGTGEPPAGIQNDLVALQEWASKNRSVNEFALSPDGRFAAGATVDGTVALWRLTPSKAVVAKELLRLDEVYGDFYGLGFSPDGKTLVMLARPNEDQRMVAEAQGLEYSEGAISSWSVSDEGLRKVSEVFVEDRPGTIAFAPDGSRALVAGSSQSFWQLRFGEGGRFESKQGRLDDTVTSLSFLPDGKRFLSGTFDGLVTLWGLDEQHELGIEKLAEFRHHQAKVRDVAVAIDGRWAVAGSPDKSLSFWALGPAGTGSLQDPVVLETGGQYPYGIAVHPHGPFVAVGGENELQVYRVHRDKLSHGRGLRESVLKRSVAAPELDQPAIAGRWTSETELQVIEDDGTVASWTVGDKVVQRGKELLPAAPGKGGYLAAFVEDAVVHLLEEGGLLVRSLDGSKSESLDPFGGKPASAVAVRGSCVLVAGAGGLVSGNWEATGLTLTPPVPVSLKSVRTLAISPSGAVVVAGSREGAAGVILRGHLDLDRCALSAALGTDSMTAPAVPTSSVLSQVSYPGGGGPTPRDLVFSSDGSVLYSGPGEGAGAYRWMVSADGALEASAFLEGHRNGVDEVAVSADDAWLLTGGGHGELLLWRNEEDGSTLVEALLPPAPRSYFHTDLAFSPSGSRVMATGGWHTHGRLWVYELSR